MEFIKNFVQKHSKLIVTINIILLILSIGWGKATVLNSIVIFLLFILLVFMPDKAFDDDENSDEQFFNIVSILFCLIKHHFCFLNNILWR